MPNSQSLAIFDTKSYDRDYFTRALEDSEIEALFHDFRLNASTASTAAGCKAVCAFVNDTLDRPCLEALASQGVGLIALRCAGFNHVDAKAARDLHLRVLRVPAYSPHAVAEHTVALLLTLNRKIHRAYNRVRELNFSLGGLVGFDLHGKTIGIIGTGKIGRIAAMIFRGFGCRVLAYDPVRSMDWANANDITYSELDDLFKTADVISLHLPLTPQTHHLIDDRSLSLMKSGSIIVNTSRGKLVDSTAVIRALKSGHLGGVALDVYEEEEGVFFEDLSASPLQDDVLSRLLTFPNVLITAHQAFLTHEALTAISEVTVDNVRRHLAGLEPVDERVVV